MVGQLIDSQELCSVGGQAVGIMTQGLRYRTTLAYKSQMHYQNEASDFHRRFEYHYESGKNFSGAMFRVFRQNDFRRFLVLISKFSNISTPYIYEVTAELFWTTIGPAKYIDEVFWVRNWVVPPIQTNDWDRKQYFYEWCQDSVRRNEYEFWRKIFIKEFENILSNENVIRKVILHRTKIEESEQTRNLEINKKRSKIIRKFARVILSVFRQRYQTNKLFLELGEHEVDVRNDELLLALNSMTS
jgi:hypothetical protein